MIRLFILVTTLLAFVSRHSEAQISGNNLGIEEALAIAGENDPELNKIRQQIVIYASRMEEAWGVNNPELYYIKEGVDGGSFAEQQWGVSQTMSFPLTGWYRYKIISSEVEALKAGLRNRERQVIADVKRAYAELAYTIKNIELTEETVGLAEDLDRIATTREEVGESSSIDVLQAEIGLAEAENDLSEAHKAFQQARYTLFSTIGLDPEEQTYEIEFPDTLVYFEAGISQDEILQKLSEHPRLQQSQRRVEAASNGIKAAKSSYLPDLRANYYRQDYGNGYDFTGFEIGLRIPLWFALNQSKQVARSRAFKKQFEWEQAGIELNLKKEAELAWHGYETARTQIEKHNNRIHNRADSLLELTREGYRIGELDLLRVLEAQRTYLNSEQRFYSWLYNYYLQVIEMEKFLDRELVFRRNE